MAFRLFRVGFTDGDPHLIIPIFPAFGSVCCQMIDFNYKFFFDFVLRVGQPGIKNQLVQAGQLRSGIAALFGGENRILPAGDSYLLQTAIVDIFWALAIEYFPLSKTPYQIPSYPALILSG